MRDRMAFWRQSAKPVSLTDYRWSLLFDSLATLAIVTYIAACYPGPPPTWARMVYLAGIVACGISANLRRSWLSVACVVVLTAIAFEQVVTGAWLVR